MLLCRTISSMMGLTPLGKQSSTQGFDKHVTYLELQARKAITALETVKCCHEAPGEASTLWWRRPGGRLHEPGAQLWIHLYARNQAMQGTFCNLLILKRSPSAVHETPKHPSLNLWGLGWLAHQHPSCASFPTFQSNACWLTKFPMLASDLFRKLKKALEPGGPFWRSLPTWVWPAHVTLRLGQNWSCMIHDLKKIADFTDFHQPQQHQILQRNQSDVDKLVFQVIFIFNIEKMDLATKLIVFILAERVPCLKPSGWDECQVTPEVHDVDIWISCYCMCMYLYVYMMRQSLIIYIFRFT